MLGFMLQSILRHSQQSTNPLSRSFTYHAAASSGAVSAGGGMHPSHPQASESATGPVGTEN